jgi:hypothetical protein
MRDVAVNNDTTGNPSPTQRRVPVSEAAALLGISDGAVRQRLKRGTLTGEREAGRLYVLLDANPTDDINRTHDRTNELISTLQAQLEAERQAHGEARRIIAGLVERMPALEAPTDSAPNTSGSQEAADQQQGRGDVPTDTEEAAVLYSSRTWASNLSRAGLLRMFAGMIALYLMFGGLVLLILSASGESLAGIIASVRKAFSTAISSGLSSVTGDQVAIIVGSIITLIGTIASTYFGIRWSRRGRNP